MLPNRQGLSHLAKHLQRFFPLPGIKCASSMSRSQGRTGGRISRKVKVNQGKRNSDYRHPPICYVQNCRKYPAQTFRVHNSHDEWALFCNQMIQGSKLA